MTWRVLTLACLVLSGACRTKHAEEVQAPETVGVGSAEERGKLEAQARSDLAASEAKIAELEARELSSAELERLALLKALVADGHAALAANDPTRAAQLAAKAASMARDFGG